MERELDASISAAAHARSEKRQAEAAKKAAELRAQEITRELENTTSKSFCLLSLEAYIHLLYKRCLFCGGFEFRPTGLIL